MHDIIAYLNSQLIEDQECMMYAASDKSYGDRD